MDGYGNNVAQNENGMPGGIPFGGTVPNGMMPSNGFNQDEPQNAEAEPKKRKSLKINKVVVLTIATAFFALTTIVSSVFAVIATKNTSGQVEDLNAQIESLDKQNDDLLEQLAQRLPGNDNPGIQITPVVINPAEYIYVGEWGIKIKKPDDWRNIIRRYSFFNDYPQAVDVLEIIENPEVPTSHALVVNEGNVTCESVMVNYDACFVLGENTYIVTDLPAADVGGVTEAFRSFVLDTSNYLMI